MSYEKSSSPACIAGMPSVPKMPWSHPLITCIQDHTRKPFKLDQMAYGGSASWLEVHSPALYHILALPCNKSLTVVLAHGSVTKVNKQIRPKLINFCVWAFWTPQKARRLHWRCVEFISINLASEAEAIALLFSAYKLHAGATRNSPHWVCFWNLTMWGDIPGGVVIPSETCTSGIQSGRYPCVLYRSRKTITT